MAFKYGLSDNPFHAVHHYHCNMNLTKERESSSSSDYHVA
jgi:hypothetical protein